MAENVLGRPFVEGDAERVITALKKADVYDCFENLPKGIHTTVGKVCDPNGVVLSGGQSQKVAIASIYAKDCGVVILDEPSSALDPIAEHEMYKNILSMGEDRTMIFISHRLSSVTYADRIILLENGRIVEEGTKAELLAQNGKFAELFRTQAENYVDVIADEGGTE